MAAVEQVQLGASDLRVTRFVAGASGAPVTVATGVELLNEAWDAGVRVIDVRDAAAEADTAAAAWLAERQPEDAVVVAGVGAASEPPRGSDLSPQRLERDVAAAVRRLGRVDLVWLRGTDDETPLEASLVPLAEAVERGALLGWGASGVDVRQLEALLVAADRSGLPRPRFVRNRMNALELGDERDLLPLAVGEGLGVLPRAPFAGGRLTDRHVQAEVAAEEAAAAGAPRDDDADPALPRLLVLRDLARERDVSVEGLALAWLAGHPLVTAPIVAPRVAAEWDAMHEALQVELAADERERLDDLLGARG